MASLAEVPRDRREESRAVDSVLRAVDFVEERLGDDIGVEDMARAACYSPFYFSRLFAEATGHAPYDYLMRRRVAAAAEEVMKSKRSLTEIALDHGFAVQDGFGRAFRRCFGLLPSEARREGRYPQTIARTRIERAYIEEMLERPPPRAEAVDAAETIVEGCWETRIGERALPGCGVAVVERDAHLSPLRSFLGEPMTPSKDSVPKIVDDSAFPVFPAFPRAATRLPAGKRARFRIEGDARRLGFILEFAYRAWFPASLCAYPPAYDLLVRDDRGPALELPLEEPAFSRSGER